jgi:prepilin-type N-terminal cleavage/methylation domain-containing protein
MSTLSNTTGAKAPRGFTLLEIMIVTSLLLVGAALIVPNLTRASQTIRLRGSAQSVAYLFQQARSQSVKSNRAYPMILSVTTGNSHTREACVDLNGNNRCDSGEPSIELSSDVSVVSNGPSTATITCGSVGTGTCPTGVTGLNYQPQSQNTLPSFNARGLPCVGAPVCSNFDPNQLPVGFLYELQYSDNPNLYAAVSVTPAGRVNVWSYQRATGRWTQW